MAKPKPQREKQEEKKRMPTEEKTREEARNDVYDSVMDMINKTRTRLSKIETKQDKQSTKDKSGKKGGGQDLSDMRVEEVERGQVFDFAGVGEIDVQGIKADPDFDFDKLFDQMKDIRQKFGGIGDPVINDGIDQATDTILKFQTTEMAPHQQQEVPRPIDFNPREMIRDIRESLHKEFLTPAYSRGLPLLPVVWQGIQNVAAKYPEHFDQAFSVALSLVRQKEDELFRDVLDIDPPDMSKLVLSKEAKEPAAELIRILNKYYTEVMKEAAKNKDNLNKAMQSILNKVGPANFKPLFKKALEVDRELEEEIFKKYIKPTRKATKNKQLTKPDEGEIVDVEFKSE